MTRFKKIATGATEWEVWAFDDTGHVWPLAASTKAGGFEWIKELAVDGAGNR